MSRKNSVPAFGLRCGGAAGPQPVGGHTTHPPPRHPPRPGLWTGPGTPAPPCSARSPGAAATQATSTSSRPQGSRHLPSCLGARGPEAAHPEPARPRPPHASTCSRKTPAEIIQRAARPPGPQSHFNVLKIPNVCPTFLKPEGALPKAVGFKAGKGPEQTLLQGRHRDGPQPPAKRQSAAQARPSAARRAQSTAQQKPREQRVSAGAGAGNANRGSRSRKQCGGSAKN